MTRSDTVHRITMSDDSLDLNGEASMYILWCPCALMASRIAKCALQQDRLIVRLLLLLRARAVDLMGASAKALDMLGVAGGDGDSFDVDPRSPATPGARE